MNDSPLTEILSLEIPERISPDDGFLEIIGLSHYENINSRIYVYFLDASKNPKVAGLFIGSLLEIVNRKQNREIVIENYSVQTEVSTQKGRIDISIEDKDNNSVIIIENKIYHNLHNDLQDYWDHYCYDDSNKTGILLTLEPFDIPQEYTDKYINVTHQEWINQIKSFGFPTGIPQKLYTYLNDFIQTIENLSKSYEMNDLAKFYFQHAKQVQKAIQTESEANNFIIQQIEILAGKIELSTYGKSFGWRNIWDDQKKRKTFYTIWYDPLIKGEKYVEVIIEMQGDDRLKKSIIEEELMNDETFQNLDRNEHTVGQFIHFRSKKYPVDIDNIENLADFLHGKIKAEFEPVMQRIMEIIDRH